MTTATVPSPPELKTLRLEIDGEIGTLTLDRPDVLNAMSPELIGELVTAAAWLADRAPLRAPDRDRGGPRLLGRRRRQLVQARARGVRARTSRPTFAAAPTSCTRRSSTSGAFPIP